MPLAIVSTYVGVRHVGVSVVSAIVRRQIARIGVLCGILLRPEEEKMLAVGRERESRTFDIPVCDNPSRIAS